jgi:multidrug efflux pump subunit AcrA (membrane-fusion protein)
MKTTHWFWMIVIIGLLAGCRGGFEGEPPTDEQPSQAATVPLANTAAAPQPAGLTILADGLVVSGAPVAGIGFEVGGSLTELNVAVGDQLAAGDLIARLDDSELLEQIAQAELAVAQAENSLAQTQVELDTLILDVPLRQAEAQQAVALAQETLDVAQRRLSGFGQPASEALITSAEGNVALAKQALEQAEKAYAPFRDKPDGNLNKAHFGTAWAQAQQNYDAAVRQLNAVTGAPSEVTRAQLEADLAVALAQLTQADANLAKLQGDQPFEAAQLRVDQAALSLSQSQLSLAQAKAALDNAQLLAPWAGTVQSIEALPGSLVGAGSPIVTLLDMNRLEFQTTNLSERDFGQIFTGQSAVVTLKAYPNQPIEVTVLRIGLEAGAPVGDAATFPVILIFGPTELDIRPGMTGRVEIQQGP